jgi:4'-phosphopantetheinyl transferase
MHVYWWEQTEASVPASDDWLAPAELRRLRQMRVRQRISDWRLGRWVAKRAVAESLDLPCIAELEIRAADDGAPEAIFAGRPLDVTLSISHRAGVAACVVAPLRTAIGCDLEQVEPHSKAFIEQFFTCEEQAIIASHASDDRMLLAALLWSGKESALKALRVGLRVDTRSLSVHAPELGSSLSWQPLRVRQSGGGVFDGWWRRSGGMIRTVIASPSIAAPLCRPAAQ